MVPLTALQFWNDIATIDEVMKPLLVESHLRRVDVHRTVRQYFADGVGAVEDRLIRFASELLELPPLRGQSNHRTDAAVKRFLDSCRASTAQALGSDPELLDSGDELLMENLTAAWLGLYFLGIPFIHPWEKARRLSDERSGFPSGACIAKFVGDVYRNARRQADERRNGPSPKPVIVLSYIPLPLFKEILEYNNPGNRTPESVHRLAMRYALLQLRMYVSAGYPIQYFIPGNALKAALSKLNKQGFDTKDIFAHMWDWFKCVFRESRSNQSVILLHDPDITTGLPTVVLGNKVGIYTLETGSSGLHFAGNRIGGKLLESYREKLGERSFWGDPDLATDLLPLTKGPFEDAIRRALDNRRATRTSGM